MNLDVLITDDAFRWIGDPISVSDPAGRRAGWVAVEAIRRRNRAGGGWFRAPAYPELVNRLHAGRRIVLRRDGQIWSAGPLQGEPGELEWSAAPGGSGAGPGQITVRWSDDLATALSRYTYPDPTAAFTAQSTTAHWTANAAAGTVMLALVDANAGPGALAARQVAGLTLGDGTGLGATVKVRTRLEALGDVLRACAVSGGNLGFRALQVGSGIVFEVYAPTDRTGVRFSRDAGNLRDLHYRPEPPTGTAALVAGSGEGTARTMREVIDAAATARWKQRIELLVDRRQSSDAIELDQAGAEALAERGERSGLSAVTVDTPGATYGVDYDLGDQVYTVVAPGIEVADVVEAVTLTATAAGGEQVAAQIGSGEVRGDPPWLRQMRDVLRRLRNLEAA